MKHKTIDMGSSYQFRTFPKNIATLKSVRGR